MQNTLTSLIATVVMVTSTATMFAQGFVNDNDGLLDVGEAEGFLANPLPGNTVSVVPEPGGVIVSMLLLMGGVSFHARRRTKLQLGGKLLFATLLLVGLLPMHLAHAFRVVDVPETPGITAGGIFRWNAAPHVIDGVERSLDGGLRYSIAGGSYEAFRDEFQWDGEPPTVAEVQQAVEQAFANWEAVDPATGLGTMVRFVPDFATPVVIEPRPNDLAGHFRLARGAEIDIGAVSLGFFGGQVDIFGDPNASTLTLTSGVSGYRGIVSSGVDIKMSNDSPWQLDEFEEVLSHEIGHVLGLRDVDHVSGSDYYDDNMDLTSAATALATLTNSFAALIDPLDPDNSPAIKLFEPCVPDSDSSDPASCISVPGIDTAGVSIHMESSPTPGDPLVGLGPQNDDFAGRQFLYPSLLGDFDTDNVLTVQDIDLLLPGSGNDITGDGLVDQMDRLFWIEHLFGSFFGDTDLNNKVDWDDFLSLSNRYGKQGGWAAGDFDGSGDVQFADFVLLSSNYTRSADPLATVPESTGLVPTAYVMFLVIQRRRRSSH